MKLELCYQAHTKPGVFVEYDGSIWFLYTGPRERDDDTIHLARQTACRIAMFLERVANQSNLTKSVPSWAVNGLEFVELTANTRGVWQEAIAIDVVPDPTGECWGTVHLHSENVDLYFDADESWAFVALVKAQEYNKSFIWQAFCADADDERYREMEDNEARNGM